MPVDYTIFQSGKSIQLLVGGRRNGLMADALLTERLIHDAANQP